MKKSLLINIFVLVALLSFSNNLLTTQYNIINYKTKKTSKEKKTRKVNWDNHFFDASIIVGGTFSIYEADYIGSASKYSSYGGLIGVSLGYQYRFNNYFAFGPGLSVFASITYTFHTIEITTPFERTIYEKIFSGMFSGGAFMFLFMIGDFKKSKVAFLLDVGGGWLFCAKMGINIRGVTVKLGYHMSNSYHIGHNFILDVGYKINWMRGVF